MSTYNCFPTHLALGKAFCNRKEESKRLVANIRGSNPVLIISPRRYGKTSLAINAFHQLKLPYSHIDFYKELSEEDIQSAILNGVGNLISQLETTPKKLIKLATDFFANMQVRVILEKAGIKLDLSKHKKKSANIILESLENLHNLSIKKRKKVIIYMDEFQVIGEVTKNHSIEAAIREAAQKSTHVAYVFSGSNRHLIQEMFYDKKRPFYKLCDIIALDRISGYDYEKHIQHAAVGKWGKKLPPTLLEDIIHITERHPYYINKLCSLIWGDKYPEGNTINHIWDQYILENESLIEREIELLSLNQRKLLIFLAKNGPTKELFSSEFTTKLNMSLSSISRAVSVLCQKDYLYIDKLNGNYLILDPLVNGVLSR